MSAKEIEGLPPYPQPPPGVSRLDHLPTVEASIRYWEAIRGHAIKTENRDLEQSAASLRLSYEAARRELLKARKTTNRQPPETG